ncbi:MAG: hypothetical protein ACEQSH_00240 [Bacteroidia bacterium]
MNRGTGDPLAGGGQCGDLGSGGRLLGLQGQLGGCGVGNALFCHGGGHGQLTGRQNGGIMHQVEPAQKGRKRQCRTSRRAEWTDQERRQSEHFYPRVHISLVGWLHIRHHLVTGRRSCRRDRNSTMASTYSPGDVVSRKGRIGDVVAVYSQAPARTETVAVCWRHAPGVETHWFASDVRPAALRHWSVA